MSSWWNINGKYVRAYALYVLIMWLFQLIAMFLHVNMHLTKLFQCFGISQQAGLTITLLFIWVVFVWLGFIVFRAASKKFITSASKPNNETQNQ